MSVTQLQEKLKSLALVGRDASPTPKDWAAGLKVQPLKQSDNFNNANFPRTYLTPALGVEFGEGVKLKGILALPKEKRDEAVRDIAIESKSARAGGDEEGEGMGEAATLEARQQRRLQE